MAMMQLEPIMRRNNVSYRSLAALIKTFYPESKISKSTLQEMALGIKQVLPHQKELLEDIFKRIPCRIVK